MTDSIDSNIDLARFRAVNHRLVTLYEVLDATDPQNVHIAGWKLWCMNCDLKGGRIYQDIEEARRIAASLRSDADPGCKFYREAPNG